MNRSRAARAARTAPGLPNTPTPPTGWPVGSYATYAEAQRAERAAWERMRALDKSVLDAAYTMAFGAWRAKLAVDNVLDKTYEQFVGFTALFFWLMQIRATLLDVQWRTEHLATLGVRQIPRRRIR